MVDYSAKGARPRQLLFIFCSITKLCCVSAGCASFSKRVRSDVRRAIWSARESGVMCALHFVSRDAEQQLVLV